MKKGAERPLFFICLCVVLSTFSIFRERAALVPKPA